MRPTVRKKPLRKPRPEFPEYNGRLIASMIAAAFAAVWLLWFVLTYPVRSELKRVERTLEAHATFQDVNLDIPLFARTMPASVPLTGHWVPGGFSYEVHIEVKGEYRPAARQAHILGNKQIFSPYRRVGVDETISVPPPTP